MNKKSVGVFTMASILILLGVLAILSRAIGRNLLSYVLTYWPVIVFLFGGELIYFHIRYRKDDSMKIEYDFLSIGIVAIIFVAMFIFDNYKNYI